MKGIDSILNRIGLVRKSAIGPLPGDRVIYKSLRELMATQGAVLSKPYKESIWVYSCLPAGTPILTDSGICLIEDLEKGDVVYNHRGEKNTVIQANGRDYTGNLYHLRGYGLPPIQATAEHRFFIERDKERKWVKAEDLRLKDYLLTPIISNVKDQNSLTVSVINNRVKKIRKGYRAYSKDLLVDKGLMLLSGYYLAEGNIRFNHLSGLPKAVQFAFCEDERDYIEEVKSLMFTYFGIDKCTEVLKGRTVELLFGSRLACEFFLIFKPGAGNKIIPDWILQLPVEKTAYLVKGFWRGDGGKSKTNYYMGSISPSLVEGLRILLLRYGIVPYFDYELAVPNIYSQIRQTMWCLRIGGQYTAQAHRLFEDVEYVEGKKAWNSNFSYCTIVDGYAKFPLRKIMVELVEDLPVFNLEVELDHSYLAFGVATHNSINAIASNVSRVPFVIKRDIGAGLSRKIEDGPIYELFQNPNPLMSQRQLFEATMIFLGLKGEAIWIIERDNITVLPKEIWTFDPSRFTPAQNKEGQITGWLYNNGSGKDPIPFANHEILFFRYFNPYDDIRGLAPIEAAKENINQDYYATRYNSAFFKNGAKIGGFISVDGELTDEQFNRILKQFEDRHQGYDKAHKIALLEGGGKFTEASVSQKDMDYIAGKKLTKGEILAAFKVNEVVLGGFESIKSYDGIKAADKAFWEECLMPKTHYIEDHLWAKFFSHIGNRKGKGKIWGEFDLATVGSLQVNFADKIETASKMFLMGWPVNEINRRLELGMEDVPWGDEWWVPGGYLPVTQILSGNSTNADAPSKEGALEGFMKFAQEPEQIECTSAEESDFRAKIKKFIFEVRKKTLASIYNDEFVRPNLKKEFDKLTSDLQTSYFQSISTSSKVNIDKREFDVVAYISGRIGMIVEKFAELLESLFVSLEKTTMNKDNKAEKVRVIFNLLTQRSLLIAKNETKFSQAFGHKLFVRRTLGNSIVLVPEEEEEEVSL